MDLSIKTVNRVHNLLRSILGLNKRLLSFHKLNKESINSQKTEKGGGGTLMDLSITLPNFS